MKALTLFKKSLAAVAAALLILAAGPVWAHTLVSVGVTATPKTSDTGVIPSTPGGSPNAIYEYNLFAGDSLSDGIDVELCITSLTETDTTLAWSLTLQFGPDSIPGNLPGVTLPADVTFSKGDTVGTCQTRKILIASGPLADLGPGVDYNLNLKVQTDTGGGHDHVSSSLAGKDHIKVMVTVNPPPGPTCFATDSDFNFLYACDGTTAVTSGTDGRFAIVANRKNIEVATNPGQFYYNVLWTNRTGSDATVTVNFVRAGVHPQGTQAIHAAVFPPQFSGVDLAGFNAVNDGIPSGHDDALESVTVPAGWTLWVDYHLEWDGLGKLVPITAAKTCSEANQAWTVTATLSTSGGPIGDPCVAGGIGYVKK